MEVIHGHEMSNGTWGFEDTVPEQPGNCWLSLQGMSFCHPSHPKELLSLKHPDPCILSGISGDSILTIITIPTGPAKLQIRVS